MWYGTRMAEMSQESTDSLTQANKAPERPIYEVGYHLIPTLEEANVSAMAEKLRAELGKGGAEIIAEGTPSKMVLAYTVERATTGKREKYNESYFGWIKFTTERENIPALESYLRSTREIIRHLLIETIREDATLAPRRAVFSSDRLEGETIKKPTAAPEVKAEVSEEELERSLEELTK